MNAEERSSLKTMDLNGEWLFRPDPYKQESPDEMCRQPIDDEAWTVIHVPSCYESASDTLEFYEGSCWYRRSFVVPDSWRGNRIELHFESVHDHARVWLDEHFLGDNHDPFLPFSFDISEHVTFGKRQTVVVEADNCARPEDLPGKHTGWRRFGGILRDVSLQALPDNHISGVKVRADGDGCYKIEVDARNATTTPSPVTLSIALSDASSQVLTENTQHSVLPAQGRQTLCHEGKLDDAKPWSPENPTLYHATLRLTTDGGAVHQHVVRFGFRTIQATPEGLRLNGRPIRLQGWNRHEDSPKAGMAQDHDTTRSDLMMMKQAGANFVRLCHYPHHPVTLDMCDELGLIVFSEVPFFALQEPDIDEGRQNQSRRAGAAARQLKRMIGRDFNHPCICFWSVSNETDTTRPDVRRDNEHLIRTARALDPTRLCVHVSCRPDTAPFFDEDDVICVNRYPCMALVQEGVRSRSELEAAMAHWLRDLEAVCARYPDKPILVTEFGFASFAGTKGGAHGEDVHAQVMEIEHRGIEAIPRCCGAAIWCWADHAWLNRASTHYLMKLRVSPYGVLTRDRRRKEAFSVCEQLMRGRKHGA